MNTFFNASRYTIFVAIISALIGQLLMMYIGASKVFMAVKLYLLQEDISNYPEHILHSDIATALLLQGLDAFLIAVVLMYFSFSLYHLLLSKDKEVSAKLFPGNRAPSNIGDLKQSLTEVIIVILFILFLQEIWLDLENLQWTLLVMPVSIALLALSLKLVNFKH